MTPAARILLACSAAIGLLLGLSGPGWGGGKGDVNPLPGGYGAHGEDHLDGTQTPGTTPTVDVDLPPGTWVDSVVCELGGSATCVETAKCDDGVTPQVLHHYVTESGEILYPSIECPGVSTPGPPAVTNAMVERAFRRIPLAESVLVVQPPGGETLVNFATNFYTVAEPFERSVRLVGQRVDLRIWASSFGWDFGDGAVSSTSGPGAAYPDLEVTHEYAVAGRVGASVDTTYSAEFRVNGGAWEPVVGTVTMAGEPVGLRVRTATPTLVGYH